MDWSKIKRPLKIGFYGNVGNGHFHLMRALNQGVEFEAFLFLREDIQLHNNPISDSKILTEKILLKKEWVNNFVPSKSRLLRQVKDLQLDLIILSDNGPMISPYLKIPSIFTPSGWDFTVLPFAKKFSIRKFFTFIYSQLLRRNQIIGLRNCHAVVGPNDAPFIKAFKNLELHEFGVRNFLGKSYLCVDTELFRPRTTAELSDDASKLSVTHDFIVFHPSRFLIRADESKIISGHWKANDVLIRGFSQSLPRLMELYSKPVLVMLDLGKEVSADIDIAKKMVRDLQLEDNVIWLKPAFKHVFARTELAHFYSVSDIVADDFGVGWWGSVVLEALATNCEVISKVDLNVEKSRYASFPVRHAENIHEVSTQIICVAEYKSGTAIEPPKNREWVLNEHSYFAMQQYFKNIVIQLCNPKQ